MIRTITMAQHKNGKLLEYATYCMFQTKLTYKNPMTKYKQAWDALDPKTRTDFIKFAAILCKYFANRITPTSQVIMPSDREGVDGNVADIIVDNTRISIKNGKIYAKSQRPMALPRQLGMDSYDTDIYNMAYKEIATRPWLDYGGGLCKTIAYLNELYEAIYQLTQTYLVQANQIQVRKLFRFLSGEPHYQAINQDDKVVIYDFTKKPIPSSLSVSRSEKGHLQINFDNNWIYRLRVHTCAGKITKSLNLKFDTILYNQDLVVSKIEFIKKKS